LKIVNDTETDTMQHSPGSAEAVEAVVQAQLDAYNAHDVEALAAIYADDAEHQVTR
jgi:ketosteroid isomerase-like protein